MSGTAVLLLTLWNEIPYFAKNGVKLAPYQHLETSGQLPIELGNSSTVVFMGDSNTGGSQRHDGSPFPDLIGRQLVDVTIVNMGRGGDTAKDGLRRWAAIGRADICFINFGTNDAAPRRWLGDRSPVSIAIYMQSLEQHVHHCSALGAKSVIVAPLPGGSRAIARRLEPYRTAARQVAIELETYFVDPSMAFDEVSDLAPLTEDALHLNQEGHELLASWIVTHVLTHVIRAS
ncbi:SGNH/GDSL hydrolase family protein [Aurantiacibacter marinus]|nr:SGNH/GDSL hydrolase family protein [Aurantiacibacter marinus]